MNVIPIMKAHLTQEYKLLHFNDLKKGDKFVTTLRKPYEIVTEQFINFLARNIENNLFIRVIDEDFDGAVSIYDGTTYTVESFVENNYGIIKVSI